MKKEYTLINKNFLIFSLLTASLLFSGCATHKTLIKKGDKHYDRKEFAEADALYVDAQNLSPSLTYPYKHRASKLANIGLWNKSIQDLDKAIIISKDQFEKEKLQKQKIIYTLSKLKEIKNNSKFNASTYKKSLKEIDFLKEGLFFNKLQKEELNNLKYFFTISLAENAISNADYNYALSLFDNMMLSDSVKDKKIITQTFAGIADTFLKQNDFTAALYFFKRLNNYSSLETKNEIILIYKKFALDNLQKGNYNNSLVFIDNIISLSNSKEHQRLKNKILNNYSNKEIQLAETESDPKERKRRFQKALTLMQDVDKPDRNQINMLNYEISLILFNDKQHINSLEFLDRINITLSKQLTTRFNSLKIDNYLSLARVKYDEKDFVASLNYINKILSQFPENFEAHKLKSEIIKIAADSNFSLGLNLMKDREYDTAEYFINQSYSKDWYYKPRALAKLAELYEETFLFDKAIQSLNAYKDLTFQTNDITIDADNLNYRLAKLNCIQGNIQDALSQLNNLFCSSNYKYYRSLANGNSEFYNLRDNKFFNLWLYNKQRIKVTFHGYYNIPDLDPFFGTTDPRIYIEAGANDYWSRIYKERENIDFYDMYLIQDIERSDLIRVYVSDYDKDEFGRSENDLLGKFYIDSICSNKNYVEKHLYVGNNYHGTISYSVEPVAYSLDYSNLYTDSYPKFDYLPTNIYGKSCGQILLSAGYDLIESELSFYPFLFAKIVHYFNDNSIEATSDRIKEVGVKYLTTRNASPPLRQGLKRFKQLSILANSINKLSRANCI